jgi:outer membrane protein OmpA-like peptidoglycan-associated protein
MRTTFAVNAALIFVAALAAWPARADLPQVKGTDHPLVGRFEGSVMVGYAQKAYDTRNFVTGGTPDRSLAPAQLQSLEGKSTLLAYRGPENKTALEIFRNYQASLKGRGFTQTYVCDDAEGQPKQCPSPKDIAYRTVPLGTAVVENGQPFKNAHYALFRKGSEATVAVYVGDSFYKDFAARTLIAVLESAELNTAQVVVPTAADMTQAFATEGKIAVYGLYFETGKSEIKPDSKPTLDVIAALLGSDPKLALIITGYTDNVGAFEANVALSKRRAEAVVAALVAEYKVAASRLTAFGAGMTGPRTANADDAGRARNRRVELTPR